MCGVGVVVVGGGDGGGGGGGGVFPVMLVKLHFAHSVHLSVSVSVFRFGRAREFAFFLYIQFLSSSLTKLGF